MTGDEAYHADCFRCTQCDAKIDDLVFAKTSQGIYCMKCHQERKEAKRQREERERMDRVERAMEKSLPTIPESEVSAPTTPTTPTAPAEPTTPTTPTTPTAPTSQQHHEQHHDLAHDKHQTPEMPRIPQITHSSHNGSHDYSNGSLAAPVPRNDKRPNINGAALPSIDVGPPFLPPLSFGLDDIVSSGFDLGDMLGASQQEKEEKERDDKDSSPSTPSSLSIKDVQLVNGQDRSSYRLSISRADAHLSTSSLNSFKSSVQEVAKSAPSSPSPSPVSTVASKRISDRFMNPISNSTPTWEANEENMNSIEAFSLIRELRLELAKYNPMSPLIHGTPQQEYGLLLEKIEKLTQKHDQLEKSIRDLYIEKDLLGMDLEAMNEELKAKEEALASDGNEKLHMPATPNPRMSTSHDFMKQAYQTEVKALQEQKERLQREIQTYVEQRDGVLDEMQILSVRNAELSTINNDMMREMQERNQKFTNNAPASASSGFNLQNFTGKMKRNRQVSGGSQQELKAPTVARSGDSTYSFTSTNSDSQKTKRDEVQEDIFGEEIVAPKKFNWKMGGMFGKRTDHSGQGPDVPRMGSISSDTGSANGQILPPPRSFSVNSDTGSLNGRIIEDQHYFIQYNFLKPTRCDCCDDKLWGREYRCRDCGLQVHARCTHEIIPGCPMTMKNKDSDSSSLRGLTPSGNSSHGQPPTPPAKQIMFGNDLMDQLEFEQRTIPLVVEKCIEAVDERGLEVEGIYRRSGMAAEARQLVQAYDIGLQPDLMDVSLYQDICSITSVLKQYLRSLPEPLITYGLYDDFMEAIGLPHSESKLQVFRDLLDRLPHSHYATLKVLLEHLNRVTEHEHVNLMTPKNLSVVFGPTLMRNPDPGREISDMVYKNMTIEFLIVNTSDIFARSERPSTSSASSESNGSAGGQNGTTNDSPVTPTAQGGVTVAAANGLPPGFTGQRQGSLTVVAASPVLPPRRAPGHMPSPVLSQDNSAFHPPLPPRSSSGDNAPTSNQTQLQHQQQQQQPQQQQQQQPQQVHPTQFHPQLYRPQQFMQPQHQTLQQLKQQQQQREMQQREQQQREQQQQTSSVNAPAPAPAPTPAAHIVEQQQQQHANPEVDMSNFP
ncbi:hypothetical protein BGZ46_008963 [Entomortierella lignicola]|nr:hypothetical protein BGZ46_008963 [Entomortierella lignicola]